MACEGANNRRTAIGFFKPKYVTQKKKEEAEEEEEVEFVSEPTDPDATTRRAGKTASAYLKAFGV
jgi:hypothetical protein